MEKILLDAQGYENYLKEIDELKEKLNKLYEGVSKGVYSYEDLADAEMKLMKDINVRVARLGTIQIIEKHNKEENIDINDIVTVSFGEDDELSFTLVCGNGDITEDETKVSLSSPLGKAVYDKKIGDICTYQVGTKNIINVVVTGIAKPKTKKM